MEMKPATDETQMPMPVETTKRTLPKRRTAAPDRGSQRAAIREQFGLPNDGTWDAQGRYIPASRRGPAAYGQRGNLIRRDPGAIEQKLKAAYGGKAAKKIVADNRRADPALIVLILPPTDTTEAYEYVRGEDYVIVTGRPGSPFLLLRDGIELDQLKVAVDEKAFPKLGVTNF